MLQGYIETLLGIAQLAIALAGFSGVVIVFGSRREGAWHPGDNLRLAFLIESSLTAAGFALLALLLSYSFPGSLSTAWISVSLLWSAYMMWSLYSSHVRIGLNSEKHDDIDRLSNGLVTLIFTVLILVQFANLLLWKEFWPVLAALCFNLAGATMQFARLIKSAFHE
ncbi:MAG: hypothetical protein COB20_03995 [SAR86 cluster bacterium]|uniref:Uncharacterized protein n=1 Tax=SAR86 cluster bacterium TaxID=2030880 RepID=A0A2A4XCH9_9GAMM|nr:MAG: hypothetical protein COB20_03995 [SAR86 cluster bacterium]